MKTSLGPNPKSNLTTWAATYNVKLPCHAPFVKFSM